MSFLYRPLFPGEVGCDFLQSFVRKDETREIWGKKDGRLQKEPVFWQDDWSAAERRDIALRLRRSAEKGGAFGAFLGAELAGFAALGPAFLKEDGAVLELEKLHISAPYRGMGCGSALFLAAADAARWRGAKLLYISAHPGVRQQAFYRRLGARDALAPFSAIAAIEPADIQMEYLL